MVSTKTIAAFFRKNMKRILIIVPTLIVLYAMIGFFLVPAVIKAVVPEKVTSAIGRPFTLEAVSFNPFTLSLHLSGVALGDRDGGDFVSVGAITANAELVSLLTLTPTLKSLLIQAPAARVVRLTDGSFNFSDLLKPAAATASTPTAAAAAPSELPAFLVNRLAVADARFDWVDNAVTPAFSASVTSLRLEVVGLGTRTKKPGSYNLALETDLKMAVQADGEVYLAAPSSKGHVQVTGVPLPPLAPYAAPFFKGRIDSGTVGLGFDYQYPSGVGGMGLPAVRQASLTLADFQISPPGSGPPLVDLKQLAVSDVSLEPTESFLGIGAVNLAGTRVNLVRHAGGVIDLLALVVPPKAAPLKPDQAKTTAEDNKHWRIGLTALTVSDVSARLVDRAVAEPAILTVGGVDMGVSGLMLTVGKGSGMPTVEDARLLATDIGMTAETGGDRMLSVPRFSVEGVRFVPEQQVVRVASISATGGSIQAARDAGGRINLIDAIIPATAAVAAAGAANATPQPAKETGGNALEPPATATDTTRWVVELDDLAITDFTAALTDHSTAMAPSKISIGRIQTGLTGLTFTVGEPLPRVADANLSMGDIHLSAAGNDEHMAALERFDVTGVSLDPGNAALTIGSMTTAGGNIDAVRDVDGSINLLNAVMPRSVQSSPAAADAKSPPEGRPTDPFAALPFSVVLNTAALSEFQVVFTDKSLREAAQTKIKDISLRLDAITTVKDRQGQIKLRMVGARDGTLSASGDISINPPSAALKIKSDGLSIIPVQPYFSEKINALITKGKFDMEGRLTVAVKDSLQLRYTGKAAVNSFGSVDKRNVKDLLNWESLYFSGIDVSLMPLKVRLEEVALTDYYARVAVNADGSVNLKDVLANNAAPPPAGGAAEGPPPPASTAPAPASGETASSIPDVQIAKVTLQGGRVDFSDNSIQPTFETKMLDLGGTISGLSSETLARADVFLAGRLENQSPLKITGQINPLIEDQFTDIQIEFSDIDLSPFSPYTGKYIGRQLDKGKLTLVLGYKISGKKLAGENKVYLDQFTLGESVDSPDAINLPVDLAIALLKDPSGRIQIDLPVRGNLDDPEFSIGGVVIQLLINTITKIITAPFAALGSAFGGGPELSYVDFDAGAKDLTVEATEKLGKLVTAMVERPAVNIEVQGQVNPEPDGLKLREQRLSDLVRDEKLRDLLKKNPSTPPEAAATISPKEFGTYIKRVYDKTDMAKPRNPDGTLKALPPEEMEKLIFTNIAITDADLRRLALQRAEAAKNVILADERIESGRVFLREPNMTPETDADGRPKEQFSRVNFAIRK